MFNLNHEHGINDVTWHSCSSQALFILHRQNCIGVSNACGYTVTFCFIPQVYFM